MPRLPSPRAARAHTVGRQSRDVTAVVPHLRRGRKVRARAATAIPAVAGRADKSNLHPHRRRPRSEKQSQSPPSGDTPTSRGPRPPPGWNPHPTDRYLWRTGGRGAAPPTRTGEALHCRRGPRAEAHPCPWSAATPPQPHCTGALGKCRAQPPPPTDRQSPHNANPPQRSPTPAAAIGRQPPARQQAPGRAPGHPPPVRHSAPPRGGR